ncbi:MAG: ABC transporter substrate-binding protein [Deltaproteobacteria bacterium]|nr:ABC transporter substrate-binding protein [Deltaproteobacteria bacterium]
MACLRRGLGCWVFIVALSWAGPSPVLAGGPLQLVRDTIDQLTNILQIPLSPDGSRTPQRSVLLHRALEVRFDFSEMARMSLGSHWERLAARQNEFVSVFTAFAEHAYLVKIESLRDMKVVYVRERVDRRVAQVDTRVEPPVGEYIPVNYRLHLVGGEWKIYDVLIGNVSVVENYRAQFQRVLRYASFDNLLKRLQENLPERES